MNTQEEVNQRDLRLRSREIMDAVERGETFTVTRDGRAIGELTPLRAARRSVPRVDFLAPAKLTVFAEAGRFRADLDRALDDSMHDPFERARER